MRIFVTGASGFIGTALVADLLAAGHEAVGLARSDEAAARLADAGASVVRGDLRDVDALGRAAADADGVLHLAYDHELAFAGRHDEASAADLRAIEALAAPLAGTDRALVIASGTLGLTGDGRVAVEEDRATPGPGFGARAASTDAVLGLAATGVRSAVVRLPPTVHGDGDTGFVPRLVDAARASGESVYVGDGANRWPAVHRRDAAAAFRLAVESAPAGTVLHAIAEDGIPFREIAGTIGEGLGVPVRGVTPEQAAERLGFLAPVIAIDAPAGSARTRELLGWSPREVGLLQDVREHYLAPVA
jgi:nucleoside-diphosphate-sugar epimerase